MQRERVLVQSRIKELHERELLILDDFNSFEQKQTETLEHQLAYMLGEVPEAPSTVSPALPDETPPTPPPPVNPLPGTTAENMLFAHQAAQGAGEKFKQQLNPNGGVEEEEENALDFDLNNDGIITKEEVTTAIALAVHQAEDVAPAKAVVLVAADGLPAELVPSMDTPEETFKTMIRFAMQQMVVVARGVHGSGLG
jgi:hypothetical protein